MDQGLGRQPPLHCDHDGQFDFQVDRCRRCGITGDQLRSVGADPPRAYNMVARCAGCGAGEGMLHDPKCPAIDRPVQVRATILCDCGGDAAQTTHAHWCSTRAGVS